MLAFFSGLLILIMNNGYIEVYCPDNPRANKKTGFIYEHILVAEEKLGRYLKHSEQVHHIDKDRTNNNPDNLIIFRTCSDHARFHASTDKDVITYDDGTSVCFARKSINKKHTEVNMGENFMRIMNIISPDEIYYSLLRMTIKSLSKSLNISDKGLIKICKKINIPTNSSYYRRMAKLYNIKFTINND